MVSSASAQIETGTYMSFTIHSSQSKHLDIISWGPKLQNDDHKEWDADCRPRLRQGTCCDSKASQPYWNTRSRCKVSLLVSSPRSSFSSPSSDLSMLDSSSFFFTLTYQRQQKTRFALWATQGCLWARRGGRRYPGKGSSISPGKGSRITRPGWKGKHSPNWVM